MGCVKKLGMIFLAIYLVISGLIGLTHATPTEAVLFIEKGCGVVAAILILVSIETFSAECECCEDSCK